jgi:hypothetical protein
VGELAEQHRDQLSPATEALGAPLGIVFLDQRPKLDPGEMLEQLIEKTGYLYDWIALLFRDSVQDQPAANEQILLSINYRRAFSFPLPHPPLNSKVVLDRSVQDTSRAVNGLSCISMTRRKPVIV